jgi:predicted AAA+ superfamily ATPase
MKTNLQKSLGQGQQSSKLEHNIFKNSSSTIVSRLHSRSLTGRNMQIEIHQIAAIEYLWFGKQKIENNHHLKDAYRK